MAPVDGRPEGSPFRVLVTGFGRFRDVILNPSHVLATRLDGIFLRSDPLDDNSKGRAVSISSYIPPIPVCYEAVLDIAPRLQQLPYDLILHIGVGGPNFVMVETSAHKLGYVHLDETGNKAPTDGSTPSRSGFCDQTYDNLPEILHSQIDVASIVDKLKASGATQVAISNDAGKYLCDFIFYASLAESIKPQTPRQKPPLVQFVHIPLIRLAPGEFDENDVARKTREGPYDLEQLAAILSSIIWQIAQSQTPT